MALDKSSLYDPVLTENAKEVLKRRYLITDKEGNPQEEPKDLFHRVATTIAAEEEKYGNDPDYYAEKFYDVMASGIFMPNSPTLFNAGRPLGQLSACFVLPVSDTMSNGQDGIYDTLKNMALIHQSGGGTGFSFSRLRPNGSIVNSTTGVASGPVSFMTLYDSSTNVVKQGGTRRGANMGILRVDHPDILEFISCKEDTSKVTNFNISVAVTNEFMEAARNGENYDLVDPRDDNVVDQLNASDVLDLIIDHAWATGEPGLFFIDEANKYNPVPKLGKYEATNPCGEQPLLPYDVCNLGSINLGAFVHEPDYRGEKNPMSNIDWKFMGSVTKLAVRFLDNVIDANQYPLPEIRELSDKIRRIGFGPMGVADMLVRLGVPYDSDLALKVCNEVGEFLYDKTREASRELADERGTFPEWEKSIWGPDETCARNADGSRVRPCIPLRNSNINTVAPTGTISIISGCSGGIEPFYAVAFMRRQAGTEMPDVNRDFVNLMQQYGWYDEDLIDKIAEEGNIDFDDVPRWVKGLFVTSGDIEPSSHIDMQAVWQKWTDSAISKTINFPKDATKEDVRDGYLRAYEKNCKGVTVYRDGSRPEQVLSTGKTEKETPKEFTRADVMPGRTHKIHSPVGTMYVTVNEDSNNNPREVFINVGKAGGSAHAHQEAIGRLISLALQHDVKVEKLYKQLRGISSDRVLGFGENRVCSGPDAVAQILRRYLNGVKPKVNDTGATFAACPDCGSELRFEEGCETCPSCGFSQCG